MKERQKRLVEKVDEEWHSGRKDRKVREELRKEKKGRRENR